MIDRYIKESVKKDLPKKMVFIGGPRQVGKTTFAFSLLQTPPKNETNSAYLNWDNQHHRKRILNLEIPAKQPLILFDEIHKFSRWRNLVKGLFDTNKSQLSIVVTGSAQLDYYRKGGDSLQGRYHYYRIHPLSINELKTMPRSQACDRLMKWGGFPEPFFISTETAHRRWQKEYFQRVIYEDIKDLEHIREVSLIDLLVQHLPQCVGSPLSVNNLSQLLQVSHEATQRWINILERMYLVFRISPFGSPMIRAVKKEQKLYFWDWSIVAEPGPRFENLVACQLLKYCHFREDTEGIKTELRYLRDTDKREVDFVVLADNKPLFAVECKTGEKSVSSSSIYFKQRTKIPDFYQVHLGEKDYVHAGSGIRIIPFEKFCLETEMP